MGGCLFNNKTMNQEQKDFCERNNISQDQFFGKEKIIGCLDLSSLTSIPKGFNPTVGGYLDLRSGLKLDFIKMQNVPLFRNSLSWRKGKFIKVDGILCEVLIKRGNVYKIKIAGKIIESYLVTNGVDLWAHGATLKKAKEDLHFKVISEQLKKDPIKKETIITMQYYR